MKKWKLDLLLVLLGKLLGQLKPEMLTEAVDKVLDFFETKIADSETETDDKLLLPIIATIRAAFNIPDGDD